MQNLLEQAVQHHQAGRLAQAEALYRQLLAANPKHADALNLMGVLAAQQGRSEEAIRWLHQAIAIHPAGDFYFNLGEACRAAGRYEEAATAYAEAIKRRKATVEVYHALGLVADKLGRVEQAVAAQRQAAAINPQFAPAHDALCTILMREKRF